MSSNRSYQTTDNCQGVVTSVKPGTKNATWEAHSKKVQEQPGTTVITRPSGKDSGSGNYYK